MVERVAPTLASILVTGDMVLANRLLSGRYMSCQSERPDVLWHVEYGGNCRYSFESELFGYAKGAFTGAVTGKAGLIEEADGRYAFS